MKNKKQKHFEKILEYKDRFKKLPLEKLKARLNSGSLIKEAAIALRELLTKNEK